MNRIKALWHKISYLGVNQNASDIQEIKTRIFFNQTMAALGVTSVPQVIDVNSFVPNLGYLHLLWGVMCYVCLLLVAINRYHWAKHLIIASVMVSGAIVSIVTGPDTNSHVGVFGIVIYGTILFRKHLLSYFLIMIPIALLIFVLAELNLFDHHFLNHPNIEKARLSILLVQTVIIVIIISFMVKLNLSQEDLLNEKNTNLELEVQEREALLTEVHHRVKNNLQVITSLMNLQIEKSDIGVPREMLKKSQERIQSIALIHEKLYNSKSFKSIDFSSYLERLAEDYNFIYDLKNRNIELIIDVKDVFLDLDRSAPCGILMNELITNAIKYAYNDKGGKIEILGRVDGDYCILEIRDYGIGLPDNLKEKMKNSVGLRLSTGLAKQIKGTLEMKNDGGAHFIIKFKNKL